MMLTIVLSGVDSFIRQNRLKNKVTKHMNHQTYNKAIKGEGKLSTLCRILVILLMHLGPEAIQELLECLFSAIEQFAAEYGVEYLKQFERKKKSPRGKTNSNINSKTHYSYGKIIQGRECV